MNLKSKIFLVSGLLFLMGCTSVENKILDIPMYSKEKKVYSVLDNKPVNGVVEKVGYYGVKEYSTYKKGILSNLKKINKIGELTFDQSFDDMGLRHGVSFDKKGKTSEFYHGVLDGEVSSEDYRGNKIIERYNDGVLNGVQEKSTDQKLFFNQGLRTAEDTQTEVKKQSRVIWGDTPKENFTGELYGKAKKDLGNTYYAVMQIENYRDGILLSRSYYNKEGKKLSEFYFADGELKKIIRSIEYRNGILTELKNYDSDGNLDGEFLTRNNYSKSLFIQNFVKGIPHGRVEILIEKGDKLEKKLGFFDKGVYTGYRDYIHYYKDGVKGEDRGGEILPSDLVIVDIKDIVDKKSFSGYTKEEISNDSGSGNYLYHYDNGALKEKYRYENNYLIQSQHYKNDGKYIQKDYNNGILKKILNYSADGIANGKFTAYEHKNAKTIGSMVDGRIDGKSIHYHGDKIYYIDLYSQGKNYDRTIYYNYDKKQVLQIQKGVYTDRGWIRVGMDKTYYENEKLKKTINYGDKLSSGKKVEVTEYYFDGKVKSKGTMDYDLYRNIGKKIEFYENGKKKAEQNYGDQGYSVGTQKYYYSNGKIEKIESYNERGYRHGTLKTYNKDGKLIDEAQYENGYKR